MNKYLIEFIGSTFFIYVIIVTGNWLAIASALAVAILLGVPVSGGHFNPAVSITMAAAGKLAANDVIPYIICQIAGGLAALELFKYTKK